VPGALFALLRTDGRPVPPADAADLSGRLAAGGPHEALTWRGPGLAVGRRSTGPLAGAPGAPGGPVVVFEGRLDGAGAPGAAEAAVIAAVARSGTDAFAHLDGDGAFVHADPARGVLAAVDHVGTCPLFWSCPAPGYVLVASEAAALTGVAGTGEGLDDAHLVAWITHLTPAPDSTCFAAVHRVPPGHVLVAGRSGVRLHRWWRLDPDPVRPWRPEDAVAAVRHAVAGAVERRLAAAGPVVAELSGGLDSSAIVALAARSPGLGDRPLVACTYGPAVEAGWDFLDELSFARRVVDHLDRPVEHLVLRTGGAPTPAPGAPVGPEDHLRVSGGNDFTGWSLAQARWAGAGALLSGWGGDHAVTDHAGPVLAARFLSGRWPDLWRDLRAGEGDPSIRATAGRFARTGAGALRGIRGRPRRASVDAYLRRCCLQPGVATALAVRERLAEPDRSGIDLDHRRRLAFETGILADRIAGERRRALVHGVEVRYPLLDRRLVELIRTMSPGLFHRDGWGRWLFREAMRDVLPEPVRLRRDKLGGASDGVRVLARRRDDLVARAAALRTDPAVTRLVDVAAIESQVAAFPREAVLRGLPDHGVTHPALYRRGAVLRALAAGEFVASWGRS
jgi:asparagine synthase (glutamine-hydrolysing)